MFEQLCHNFLFNVILYICPFQPFFLPSPSHHPRQSILPKHLGKSEYQLLTSNLHSTLDGIYFWTSCYPHICYPQCWHLNTLLSVPVGLIFFLQNMFLHCKYSVSLVRTISGQHNFSMSCLSIASHPKFIWLLANVTVVSGVVINFKLSR